MDRSYGGGPGRYIPCPALSAQLARLAPAAILHSSEGPGPLGSYCKYYILSARFRAKIRARR